MDKHNESASGDISPSAAMLRMISGYRVSWAIYIAAQLGLADLLKEGSKPTEELAEATGTHASSLYRVMRALASVGIFAEDEPGRFALTPLAATLRSDSPDSLRAWAILALSEEHYRAWGDSMHSVRTGESAFIHTFGMGVWQYRAQHPERAKIFDEAMASLVKVYNAALLATYSFSTIKTLVDVGGGDGSLLVAILQANPKMNGVLFDLPHVAEKAKQRIAEADLEGRCEIVAGDAFDSVPSGADAYILSRVINAFDDKRAIAILQSCRHAMTRESKLLLLERVLPDQVGSSIVAQGQVMSDLALMVVVGGRERAAAEHRGLVEAAGFAPIRIIPTQCEVSVIECEPM
jgi:O-methyltransferase domain/Dimerisation domain